MITSQKFSANLRAFGKLDEAARALLAETVAYVIYQHHAHGNKDPWLKLKDAQLPGWIRDAIGRIPLGKRDKSMTERIAESRGDTFAALAFTSQAEKRAIAKAQREARAERKAAAPAAVEPASVEAANSPIESEAESVEVSNALIVDGSVIDLTPSEAEAMMIYLDQIRMPKLAIAA